MCTVIFISENQKQYFASLRDESPKRPLALPPAHYKTENATVLMPKDPLAGGTWIGISEYRQVIILLNGGFENHVRKENYLKSRGLIVMELLQSKLVVVEWELMDLSNIEPFTLVVWTDDNLFELVWDGQKKTRKRLNALQSHIWSSSTLYSKAHKLNKEDLFKHWKAMEPPISSLSLLEFFKSNKNEKDGFLINREEKIKTLSYSFIELNDTEDAIFDYYDLNEFKHYKRSISLVENSKVCAFE